MRARTDGFTLIEVLVTLVVLGFLIAGLAQGIRFGLLAWDTQARTIALNGDLDSVDRALRHMIEQYDAGMVDDDPQLTGTAHTLLIHTELPEAATGLVTRRAQAALGVDEGHRLVLRWTPSPHAETLGKSPPAGQAVLVEGVDHIDLAYWKPADKGGGWVSAWEDPDPPALVRIHIAFRRGDQRHWPDIVAATTKSRLDE
jgi:general secretion pathway protein J